MRTLNALLAAGILAAPVMAWADHGTDWDAWYDGDVHVDLRVAGGSGAVVQPGDDVRMSFRVEGDAYVAVYAIDTQGDVRLLFPRFWLEEAWVEAGVRVRLNDRALASSLAACTEPGIVYVQAVASPVPFDWRRAGLVATDHGCEWWHEGRALRVQGDPLLGCNEVNRLLFPSWDEAVFAAGAAWYYVGHEFAHPGYLCGVCAGRHRGYHEPWSQVRAEASWDWERGRRHCRPLYRPLFVYHSDRRVLRHAGRGFEPRFSPGDRSPSPDERRRREVLVDAPRRARDADGRRER